MSKRKHKKYNYNPSAQTKKIVLIAVAVVLVIAAAIAVFIFLGSNSAENDVQQDTGAYIDIMTLPDKTTYSVGESPNWSGMKIRFVMPGPKVTHIGPEDCVITGFDSSAPVENQIITVKYGLYTDTFPINIVDYNKPNTPTKPDNSDDPGPSGGDNQQPVGKFCGMTLVSLPKTQYKVGEWLNVEGGVLLLKYTGGGTREIPLDYYMVRNFTNSKPGTYTLNIRYMEDGYRAEVTYEITVTE